MTVSATNANRRGGDDRNMAFIIYSEIMSNVWIFLINSGSAILVPIITTNSPRVFLNC